MNITRELEVLRAEESMRLYLSGFIGPLMAAAVLSLGALVLL